METASFIDALPDELLQDILSQLDWRKQLAVRRVSRRWRTAVDGCLARRQELCISGEVPLGKMMKLLKSMPNLQRLDMTQLYRSIFLNHASVDRLCTSCPHLQELILGWDSRLDESEVLTLLRRLPGLRVLAVSCRGCEGPSQETRQDRRRRHRQRRPAPSRLPAALASLSLRDAGGPDSASARQVTCFPQLQEFDLSRATVEVLAIVFASCPQLKKLSLNQVGCAWGSSPQLTPCPQLSDIYMKNTYDEVMAAVLPACPGLERLCADGFTVVRDCWTPLLSHCPQLRFLSIYRECESEDSGIDLYGVLNACRLLERVVLFDQVLRLPRPGPDSIGHQFGLTHLKLYAELNDSTFRQLADLLPALRQLKLLQPGHLTERGLANGLRRLISLQVLHLDDEFIITPTSPVFAALGELPLEKLKCRLKPGQEATVLGVVSVLRHCQKLTVLYLPDNQLNSCRSLANKLSAAPPVQNEVTVVLKGLVPADAELMPSNIRVMKDDYGFSSHFYE